MTTPATRPFLRRGPSGPLMPDSGGLVRLGYDQIVEEVTIPAGSGIDTFIARNMAGDPLEVAFPSFTDGDVLEVDFRLNGFDDAFDPSAPLTTLFTKPVISVDGGTTWFFLVPATGVEAADNTNGGTGGFSLSSLTGIVIHDPMIVSINGIPTPVPVTAAPKVRVSYTWDEPIFSGAGELDAPSCTLKCTEYLPTVVFQGPQGSLTDGI